MIINFLYKICYVGIIMLFVFPSLSGCRYSIKPETYYCYDEHGRPLEGVLFVCQYIGYTLMSYRSAGADYRFSDAQGVVYFGDNEVTKQIRGTEMRFITLVYSNRLHSGAPATGHYVNPDEPLPNSPITGKRESVCEYGGNLTFLDCSNDPIQWHLSLCWLIDDTRMILNRTGRYEYAGIETLETLIVPFAEKERADFLNKYGNELVPVDYASKIKQHSYLLNIPQSTTTLLRFVDITPTIK